MTKKGNDDIKSFSDIKGKNAAETKTSNWNQTAQENGANIVSVNDFAQAVDAITSGRADVTLKRQARRAGLSQAEAGRGCADRGKVRNQPRGGLPDPQG